MALGWVSNLGVEYCHMGSLQVYRFHQLDFNAAATRQGHRRSDWSLRIL